MNVLVLVKTALSTLALCLTTGSVPTVPLPTVPSQASSGPQPQPQMEPDQTSLDRAQQERHRIINDSGLSNTERREFRLLREKAKTPGSLTLTQIKRLSTLKMMIKTHLTEPQATRYVALWYKRGVLTHSEQVESETLRLRGHGFLTYPEARTLATYNFDTDASATVSNSPQDRQMKFLMLVDRGRLSRLEARQFVRFYYTPYLTPSERRQFKVLLFVNEGIPRNTAIEFVEHHRSP